MNTETLSYHITIAGSPDFSRRMASTVKRFEQSTGDVTIEMNIGNLAELKALALEHRPEIILFDVGFRSTPEEVTWLRGMLEHIRDRLGRSSRIIAACTAPERFALAGGLLFQTGASLLPSGLLDDFLITPPAGAPLTHTLEEQLANALSYYIELAREAPDGKVVLPSLWDDHWVPAMCDPASRDVWLRWLPRYARYVNENPLILGPTGSGKTRLAAAMHHLSGRRGPFISITPRDFSSTELVQAELFGAVPGAYTGAVEKWGLVARAERGTLFIDELQSIDRDLQGKLITFVENKTYRRVGEAESHQADVRFVFATNRSLQDLVDADALRDDFGYRLERLQLNLLPLHERRLDIAAGICFALGKVLRERTAAVMNGESPQETSLAGLTSEAYRLLYASSWPGNLRQLENTIAKLVEIADISRKPLIEAEPVQQVLTSTLGHRELRPHQIFSRAMHRLLNRAENLSAETVHQFVADVTQEIRHVALDVSGGDPELAAELVHDEPIIVQLYAKSHLTEIPPSKLHPQRIPNGRPHESQRTEIKR